MGTVGSISTPQYLLVLAGSHVGRSSLKASREQIDDRIVEVHWDPSVEGWRMMRFRDDKPHGNHRKVVENIIQSIADGVEKEAVIAFFVSKRASLLLRDIPARRSSPAHSLSRMPGKRGTICPHSPRSRRRSHRKATRILIRICSLHLPHSQHRRRFRHLPKFRFSTGRSHPHDGAESPGPTLLPVCTGDATHLTHERCAHPFKCGRVADDAMAGDSMRCGCWLARSFPAT